MFEEGINKFPDEISFYICLARIYIEQNNFEMAQKIMNDAINKGFESVSLYYYIGQLYFVDQQFSISREFLFNALRLNANSNNNDIIHYAVGNSFYKEKDFVNAELHYQISYKESKEKDYYWFGFCGLIAVYCEQTNIEKAQVLITEFIIDKKYFFNSEIYELFPFYFDLDVYVEIIPIHEIRTIFSLFKKIKLSTTDNLILSKYWLIRTKLTRHLNRNSENLTALKNVLKYSSLNIDNLIYQELTSIYYDLFEQKIDKKQDVSGVLESFVSDVKKYPPSFKKQAVDNLHYFIDTLFKSKNYEKISELYQLFTELQITEAEAWFEVAYSLNELKHKEEAKQAYLIHMKEKGETSASLNNLANIY